MSIDKAEQRDIVELNEQIVEGKKAFQAVCEYVDWLLSIPTIQTHQTKVLGLSPPHSSVPEAAQRYCEYATI